MARADKDPFAPLEGVVSFLLTLLVGMCLIFGFSMFYSNGVSVLGMGAREVCVDSANAFSSAYDDELSKFEKEDLGYKAHTSSSTSEITICNTKPGVKEQALSGLSIAPTTLVFVGFLVLTRRSIKYARSSGPFSAPTARRVQQLGRYLLIGLVVAAVIEWIAKGLLLSTMIEGKGWASGPTHLSVPSIIGALGIVTVGRILQRAVELQDEADATV